FAGRPSWAAFPAGDPYLLYKAGLDLATALAAAPDDAEALLESAELERSRGLLGPALRQARRGLEVHPDDLRMYLKAAELCALVGKRSEAIECLRDGMKAWPNEPQLPLQLVELLIQEGRHEEAATLLARLKKWGVEPAVLDYLDGRRKAAREEWLEASKALEGAYPALVRWPETRRQ